MIESKAIFVLSITLFFLCSVTGARKACFAQAPTVSQIERTQELTEKEGVLRNRLEEEEKIFIKKIIVEGVTLLNDEEIKQIILPFQKKWFAKDDIQQMLELIKLAYKEKGYIGQLSKISYQIKKKHLIIKVEESTIGSK